MTNALDKRPNYIDNFPSINFAQGFTSSQPPRISLTGDKFTLMDELGDVSGTVEPALTLDVVIVGANPNISQVFYEPKKEGESETFDKPPVCFSDNGKAPSEQSLDPQHATCSGCPRKAWTRINALGNKVPWCQARKKVAVLVAGAGETVYLLSVPPKSHKDAGDGKGMTLQPYQKFLDGQHPPAPVQCVITRLKIVDKMLRFECVGWVPESSMPFIRETVDGDMPANVVNAFDTPILSLPAPAQLTPGKVHEVAKEAVQAALQAREEPPFGGPTQSYSLSSTPASERGTFAPEPMFTPTEQQGLSRTKRTVGRPRAVQKIETIAEATPTTSFGMVSDSPAPPTDIQAKIDRVFAKFGPQ